MANSPTHTDHVTYNHHDDYDEFDDHDDHADYDDYDDDRHNDLFLGWSELCDVCVVALLNSPEKSSEILL